MSKKDTIAENLVNCWIKMLREEGFSYDEMIEIFRTVKLKADCLIAKAQL